MTAAGPILQRQVREAMRSEVRVVAPDMPLPEVERRFIDAGVSGFPVVEHGKLVGVVTRSDIVRQLCVEQSLAEMVSDYYLDIDDFEQNSSETLDDIGDRLGRRIERLHVADVMRKTLLSVSPDDPLAAAVQVLLKHRVHRVLVTQAGRLVGIVTALDLVRFFAEQEL